MPDFRLLKDRVEYILKKTGIGPSKLAKIAKVSPASVSDWKSGKSQNIKLDAVLNISEHLGFTPQWIGRGEGAPELQSVKVLDDDQKLTEDDPWVEIPEYTEIEFGCGPGMTDPSYEQEHTVTPRACHRSWLQENGLKASSLASVKISGDSMYPTISDGDSVIINMDDKLRIEDGGIYAFKLNGELLVKRLMRSRVTGDITIISDNPSYGREVLRRNDESVSFVMIGRVIYRSGRPQ